MWSKCEHTTLKPGADQLCTRGAVAVSVLAHASHCTIKVWRSCAGLLNAAGGFGPLATLRFPCAAELLSGFLERAQTGGCASTARGARFCHVVWLGDPFAAGRIIATAAVIFGDATAFVVVVSARHVCAEMIVVLVAPYTQPAAAVCPYLCIPLRLLCIRSVACAAATTIAILAVPHAIVIRFATVVLLLCTHRRNPTAVIAGAIKRAARIPLPGSVRGAAVFVGKLLHPSSRTWRIFNALRTAITLANPVVVLHAHAVFHSVMAAWRGVFG